MKAWMIDKMCPQRLLSKSISFLEIKTSNPFDRQVESVNPNIVSKKVTFLHFVEQTVNANSAPFANNTNLKNLQYQSDLKNLMQALPEFLI
ncbi:hypothetical protein BpHYR1_023116 [Brachionus plicatilis]|uniref:Uncharacterized protein n=1 Tax=Brachionus plicatilis TaxID=10195 RepID=A0A3M7Q789_BRAPC|nr:hypothetical protein BpHYR1_023116 [Brachionus plicatilis]